MPDIPINDNIELEGVSKETETEELEEIELSEEVKRKYQNRVHFTFWDRLRLTWRGKTDVGKALGIGLDIAESFAPKWVAKTRTLIQHNQKPMVQKILSIKNFINLKDENGNFSWSELGASVLQIVLAGAIVYGAQTLGIWDGLLNLINQ